MSKKMNLNEVSSEELVKMFEQFSLEMYVAENVDNIKKYNKIYIYFSAVERELKCRTGDHRRLLLPFLDHPNIGVRLLTAKSVYYIDTSRARAVIEQIARSRRFPQAGSAGMTLAYLDEGISQLD